MKSTFDIALDFVLDWEGGYVNHPLDKGGPTNLGITENALRVAQGKGLVDKNLTVRELTRETVAPIYWSLYWEPVHAEDRDYDIALVLFDAAVNHGVRTSIRLLQRGLNALGGSLAEDGLWGRKTEQELFLAETYYSNGAALAAIQKRSEYYDNIVKNSPTQKAFLSGWKNRIAALRQEVIFA